MRTRLLFATVLAANSADAIDFSTPEGAAAAFLDAEKRDYGSR
jgi:hypothetical protein